MLIRSLLTGFTTYVSASWDEHTLDFPTLRFSLMSFPLILNLKVDKNGFWDSQVAQWLNNPLVNAEDASSIPVSGRFPGRGNGNPLQYPCLENYMDRGAWWAIVHGFAKSQTQLSK